MNDMRPLDKVQEQVQQAIIWDAIFWETKKSPDILLIKSFVITL